MDEILLDSDILIDHLRGYEPARQYLKRFEVGAQVVWIDSFMGQEELSWPGTYATPLMKELLCAQEPWAGQRHLGLGHG